MEKDEAYAVHLVNSMDPSNALVLPAATAAAPLRNPQVKGTVAESPSGKTSMFDIFTRKQSPFLHIPAPAPTPAPAPAAPEKLQWPANGFTVSNDPKVEH
jgi:hypothetical protein